MERQRFGLAGGLALPAMVWAFAFERVLARRRGLAPRINGGNVTVDGDTWHYGVSEDETNIVVLHERAARQATDGHQKVLRLLEEKGNLLPVSKAQWREDDADAKRLQEKQSGAVKRLAEIEDEIKAIEGASESAGTERLEIPIEEIADLAAGVVSVVSGGASMGGKPSTQKLAGAGSPTPEQLARLDKIASRLASALPVAEASATSSYTIPGLTAPQMSALTEAFPDKAALSAAADEEITNVSGIGAAALTTIKAWLAEPDPAAEKAEG